MKGLIFLFFAFFNLFAAAYPTLGLKGRDSGPHPDGETVKYFGNDPAQLGVINGTRPHGEFWQTTLEDRVKFCKKRKTLKNALCGIIPFTMLTGAAFCTGYLVEYDNYKCHALLKEYKMMVEDGEIQLPKKEPEPDFLPSRG